MTNIDTLLTKLHKHFHVKNDRQLAAKLGLSLNSVGTWRSRGTIPYELLARVAEKEQLSLDDLLLEREQIEQYWRWPDILYDHDSLPQLTENWDAGIRGNIEPGILQRHHIAVNQNIEVGYRPEPKALVIARDDAMSPIINNRDLVVILVIRVMEGPGVYALVPRNLGSVTFRRLIPTTGSDDIDVIAENASFPREKITDPRALLIIGKAECALHYL